MTGQLHALATRRFVDTHVHSWDALVQRHSWLDDAPELPRQPGLPPLSSTAAAGVTGIILVEGGADPADADAELDRLLELRRADPRVLGVIGVANPRRSAADPLEGLVGLRLALRGCAQDSIETTAGILADATAQALPVDILCGWAELPLLAAVMELVPTAQVVIDHLGGPPTLGIRPDGEALASWRRELDRLAAFPGCHIKLSALAAKDSAGAQLLTWAVDAIGTARCVVGSDWPVTEALTGYGEWFTFVERALGDRLDDGIAWSNALRLYRVGLP